MGFRLFICLFTESFDPFLWKKAIDKSGNLFYSYTQYICRFLSGLTLHQKGSFAMMKKLFAIVCACLCLGLAVTAYAENDGDTPVDNTASQETVVSTEETVSQDDETVGENEDISSGEEISSEETVSDETSSETQSEVSSAEPTENPLPTATPRPQGGNTVVDEEDVIVNYASSEEEMPDLGVLIWSICGVLLAGCAVIFAYKFVKWRQSK